MLPSAPTKFGCGTLLLVPGGGHGTSPSLEESKAAFKESWFSKLGLTSALELAEAARERLKGPK
jgi:hypothetical protein